LHTRRCGSYETAVRFYTHVWLDALNYDNDDFIPPSEVENWERRLGFKLPPQQLS
jgi:hypothetical protein